MGVAMGILLVASLGGTVTFFLVGCHNNAVAPQFKPAAPIPIWDNSDWQLVLDKAVTADGYVKYDVLDNPNDTRVYDALQRYCGKIAIVSPQTRPELFPSDKDKLAYYINVYNAQCMLAVLKRKLEKDPDALVDQSGVFLLDFFPVGGDSTKMNLDTLERKYVRSADDPRVHFAINCMSRSCPPLRREAYEGAHLDQQLADQGHRFLSDPRGAQKLDEDTVGLNAIFWKFYPEEFKAAFLHRTGAPGDLLQALRVYANDVSPVNSSTKWRGMEYDWHVNRAP
jgi:hypothetical protein